MRKASCTAIGAGSVAGPIYLRFGFGTQTAYDCLLTHGTTYYINFRDSVTPRGSVSSQFAILNRTDGGPIDPTTCTLTAAPASIDAGVTSTLTASCSPAATSFSWTGGTCVGTTGASCTVMPLVTTTYSVAEINSDGTGVPVNVTVTVAPLPTCTLTATTSIWEVNGPTTLTASCSPAATSFSWTGGTCVGTTGAICTVTPAASTTYTVAGRNAGGTGAAVSVTVTVTPTLAPTITGVSPNYGSATISFTTPPQFTRYTVTCTAADRTTRTATGTGSPITVQGLTGGVPYTCAVTASNGTTSSASSVTVPVTARSIVPMMMQLLFD